MQNELLYGLGVNNLSSRDKLLRMDEDLFFYIKRFDRGIGHESKKR
jgi:hypothetical protein